MKEPKFTPGPWEVSPSDPCRINIKAGVYLHPDEPRVGTAEEATDEDEGFHDDWNIGKTDGDHYSRGYGECVANARLIAAAPEMYAELVRLRTSLREMREAELYGDMPSGAAVGREADRIGELLVKITG